MTWSWVQFEACLKIRGAMFAGKRENGVCEIGMHVYLHKNIYYETGSSKRMNYPGLMWWDA